MVLLRYPGTKTALAKRFVGVSGRWCEPFVGAGGMALTLAQMGGPLGGITEFYLGDADRALVALWNSVIDDDPWFARRLADFAPSLDEWQAQREILRDPEAHTAAALGFAKLAVHQMSYSGLGVMAGGPIGGESQSGEWDIACRWNADAIARKFRFVRRILAGRLERVHHHGWSAHLAGAGDATVYIDPPYFEVGAALYQQTLDHAELADHLQGAGGRWWLSYDDAPWVRDRYAFADVQSIDLRYSIARKRTQSELLITPKGTP